MTIAKKKKEIQESKGWRVWGERDRKRRRSSCSSAACPPLRSETFKEKNKMLKPSQVPTCGGKSLVFFWAWALPEGYCKKDPCNSNTDMFVSKVGIPLSKFWSTSSWLILSALLVGEKQYEIGTKSPGQDLLYT